MDFVLPDIRLELMLPELFLFIWALVVLTVDIASRRRSGDLIGYLTLAGLVVSGLMLAVTDFDGGRGFGLMFISDAPAFFFKIIFLGAAFLAVGSSFGIVRERITNHRGEFYGLLLFSTIGMMFLASSNELLMLYIGLELTTIPLFVMAAYFKDDRRSVEAGIKYFVIGALSSALLLYGLSFLYGMTGTTSLTQMKINLALTEVTFHQMGYMVLIANILILAGIGFKLALPPFHQWAPDVYEGAPTPVAAFLSVGSKAAGLVAFAKIFANGLFGFYSDVMAPNDWGMLAGPCAMAALIVGNVLAVRQSNIKRMLAYSSIAQAGYIMIGMVSQNFHGMSAVAYYIFVYMFANMGAFAIVAAVEDRTGSCQIETYRGLSRTSPFLALSMALFLLSLAGIPPMAGFLAKYKVFAAAIDMVTNHGGGQWLYWLVGIGLITAVFSLFYYANIIKQMYFDKVEAATTIRLNGPAAMVVVIGLIGIFVFGLVPEPLLGFAGQVSAAFGFALP